MYTEYGVRRISLSSCTRRSNSAPEEVMCLVVGKLPRGENVLFEKALLDQFLQIHSEHPAMDGLVPFAVMVGAVRL